MAPTGRRAEHRVSEWLALAYVGPGEVAARLLLAAGLAAVIGIEREARNKPMGLRTFMLVSVGAAGFSLIVMELIYGISETEPLQMDPSRVMQGIIGGIGFLGAGAIIQGHG